MRILIAALIVLVVMPTAASAETVTERVTAEAAMGREFWQARDVTGCEAGFSIEIFNESLAPAGQGGFCRVRINTYWLRPNRWGMTTAEECALVFHEVRHALPGGEHGGIDGQGHTESGLMTPEVATIPYECVRWARERRHAGRLTSRRHPHPLKGVYRGRAAR